MIASGAATAVGAIGTKVDNFSVIFCSGEFAID
jgi:hypothetical protein